MNKIQGGIHGSKKGQNHKTEGTWVLKCGKLPANQDQPIWILCQREINFYFIHPLRFRADSL